MKKKRILSYLVLFVVIILALALVACGDYKKEEEEKPDTTKTTYSHTITNGTFYDSSTTSTSSSGDVNLYDTVANWSSKDGGISNNAKGTNGILTAAIDLSSESVFNSVAAAYFTISKDKDGNNLEESKKMAYPGLDSSNIPQVEKKDDKGNVVKDENGNTVYTNEDTKALALATTQSLGSIYAQTASSISLNANSYYMLQFSVCSWIYDDGASYKPGAWFAVTGDIEYWVECINTNNAWKTYYLFIETNKNKSISINVQCWLGYGPAPTTSSTYANDKKDVYSTRGVALFDNILCEEISAEEFATQGISTDVVSYGDYAYNANKYEDEAMNNHYNFNEFASKLTSVADTSNNDYVQAYSNYYLVGGDMEVRSHITSFQTNSYRKYFYTFRENYTRTNLEKYSITTSLSSLDKPYYGSVDLAKLYDNKDDTDDNYNSIGSDVTKYNIIMPTAADWDEKIMNSPTHKVSELSESWAMMLYNYSLAANKIESSEDIIIDANAFYEISVYVYVWCQKDTDTGTYYLPYNKYSKKELPVITDNTYGMAGTNLVAYYLYKNDSINPFFTALTDAEITTYINNYSDTVVTNLGEYAYDATKISAAGSEEAACKTWLYNLLHAINEDKYKTESDITDAMVKMFYYHYLYTQMKDDPTYGEYVTQQWFKTRHDYVTGDFSLIKEADEKLTKDVDEYNKDKAAYESSYSAWENANPDGPVATIKLSGVGDGLEKQTTGLNSWQKITFYVSGNQLTRRSVNVALCLGTGSDTDTYMIGGAFFDNIYVREYTKAEAEALGVEFTTISEIESVDQVSFGGLYGTANITDTTDTTPYLANWENEVAKDTAAADKDALEIKVNASEGDAVEIAGVEYYLYILKYTHTVGTASTLSYVGTPLEIAPNSFYRFAFMVRTTDLNSGFAITLYYGKDPADLTKSLNSGLSAYKSEGEWSEVVYYIQGDLVDTNYVTMKVTLGSGTRFSTDSYEKGSIEFTAFNCLKIDYDEYKSHETGDKIISDVSCYSLSYDIESNSIKFTNPYYGKLNYEKTDDDNFDANNQLIGIGTTADWTIVDEKKNTYDTATGIQLDTANKKITWTSATGVSEGTSGAKEVAPVKYEIWAKYTDSNDKVQKKLYDVITFSDLTAGATFNLPSGNKVVYEENTDGNYEFTYTITEATDSWAMTYFAVKEIGEDGVSELTDFTNTNLGLASGTVYPTESTLEKSEAKAGTIVVKSYETAKGIDLFDETAPIGTTFVSPYPTLLTISSNYLTSYSIHSATVSLTSASFYKVSVWVRTDVGTYASITVGGTSGSLTASTNSSELGFVYVTTEGAWKEYCFYIQTDNFNTNMYIQYSLGNPYANKNSDKIDSDSVYYYKKADLSKGNVYFNAAKVTTITEDEYINNVDIDNEYRENHTTGYASQTHERAYTAIEYYIYTMEYNIDSFDTFNTSTDDDFGNTPTNYTYGYDSDLSKGSDKATYGIYNHNSTDENMENALSYLYSSTSGTTTTYAYNDVFAQLFGDSYNFSNYNDDNWNDFLSTFLTINRDDLEGGDNVLVLSNKNKSGYSQYYTLNSSYTQSVEAGKYFKITFTARTLIAGVNEVKTTDTDGKESTSYTYYVDNVFGEFRVTPDTSATTKTQSQKINSYVYGNENSTERPYQAVTYTMYLHNPTDAAKTMSWGFYLGDEPKEDDADNVLAKYVVGLMAVDLIVCEEVSETDYTAAKTSLSDSKVASFYEYPEKTEEETTDEDDDDDNKEEEKDNFWKNLLNNEFLWLYISSFVIAIVIIIVVIVIIVRYVKKKHPKEVVGENVVKTEKDIKVIPTTPDVKEDALEADEYVDNVKKPIVQQRTVQHKKKKK